MAGCVRRWALLSIVWALMGCSQGKAIGGLNVQSRLDVAAAAQAAGANGVAINMLAEAASRSPDNAAVQQRYVRALVDAGRPSEGVKVLADALHRQPDSLVLRYEDARIKILQGEPERALESLKQIVRLRPDYVAGWCAEGVAYDLLGDFVSGGKAYDRAANLAPYDDIVANDQAVSLLLQGQPQTAAKILQLRASKDPSNNRASNNLAIAEALSGNRAEIDERPATSREATMIAEAARLIEATQPDSRSIHADPDTMGQWR